MTQSNAPTRGFVKVPNAVALDSDLSLAAFRVYVAIRYHARPEFDRPCWAGQKRLAAECGLSRAGAQLAIDELEHAGYIEIERRPGATSSISITEPEEIEETPLAGDAYSVGTPPANNDRVPTQLAPLPTELAPLPTQLAPGAYSVGTEVDVRSRRTEVEKEGDTRADARAPSFLNGDRPADNGGGVEPEPDQCECEDPKPGQVPVESGEACVVCWKCGGLIGVESTGGMPSEHGT